MPRKKGQTDKYFFERNRRRRWVSGEREEVVQMLLDLRWKFGMKYSTLSDIMDCDNYRLYNCSMHGHNSLTEPEKEHLRKLHSQFMAIDLTPPNGEERKDDEKC